MTSFIAEQMKVITRDIEVTGTVRTPKPHQTAKQLFMEKFLLLTRCSAQAGTFYLPQPES